MDELNSLIERIEKADWYWCGYPGHLIVASDCRFHLHTRIGQVIVSTVGDYHPQHRSDSVPQNIGCDRKFETFVFVAKDTDRPEGEPLNYSEIDREGSNDSEESERQHHAMCEKWATAEMQAAALRAQTSEDNHGQ